MAFLLKIKNQKHFKKKKGNHAVRDAFTSERKQTRNIVTYVWLFFRLFCLSLYVCIYGPTDASMQRACIFMALLTRVAVSFGKRPKRKAQVQEMAPYAPSLGKQTRHVIVKMKRKQKPPTPATTTMAEAGVSTHPYLYVVMFKGSNKQGYWNDNNICWLADLQTQLNFPEEKEDGADDTKWTRKISWQEHVNPLSFKTVYFRSLQIKPLR